MSDKSNEETNFDPEFLKGISALAEQINELNHVGTALLTPEVESVIRNKITDEKTVEHLLDQLLTYAACDEGLALFKRLLRYFYPINPHSVTAYVQFYREMYDDDYQNEDEEDD